MFEFEFADDGKIYNNNKEITIEEFKNICMQHGEVDKGFHKVFIKDDKGVHAVYKYCTKITCNAGEFVFCLN